MVFTWETGMNDRLVLAYLRARGCWVAPAHIAEEFNVSWSRMWRLLQPYVQCGDVEINKNGWYRLVEGR